MTSSNKPRLILVDDNIRNTGGHYCELATLLLGGAQQLGFQPVIAANREFDQPETIDDSWQLIPTFATRRLVDWSLGIDGDSTTVRDIQGKPIGGSALQNTWNRITDQLARPPRRPTAMLRQWSSDLVDLLTKLKPTSSDVLLVNTGDDFTLLALAAAMQRLDCPPLRIDFTFHFALYDSKDADSKSRLKDFSRQVNACIKILHRHQLRFHATTDALAKQIRESGVRKSVTTIPYPTRSCPIAKCDGTPIKAVLAGLPRREKGRAAISGLLSGLEQTLLKTNRYQVSMHMPEQGWEKMVPPALHRAYQKASQGNHQGPLEVMTSYLTTDQYHTWLDTADAGLFLYAPDRYVARCSGVLLEMMARGVPVIVPDRCWLAEQVRAAGGHRSIGFIYQDRSEIPSLLDQFAARRDEIVQRARRHASVTATRHEATNTLRVMGLADHIEAKQVA